MVRPHLPALVFFSYLCFEHIVHGDIERTRSTSTQFFVETNKCPTFFGQFPFQSNTIVRCFLVIYCVSFDLPISPGFFVFFLQL